MLELFLDLQTKYRQTHTRNVHTHTHTHTPTHTRTYVHTHVQTDTCTHTCVLRFTFQSAHFRDKKREEITDLNPRHIQHV